MKNTIVVPVIVAVVMGGAGFFAGMKYQESKPPFGAMGQGRMMEFRGGNGGQDGNVRMMGGNGASMAFRPVTGEIISADEKSITVKMEDGSSKIVLLSEITSINKADAATIADLKTGETVLVVGKTNSDGSVSAQNIQLNPVQNMGSTGEKKAPSEAPKQN